MVTSFFPALIQRWSYLRRLLCSGKQILLAQLLGIGIGLTLLGAGWGRADMRVAIPLPSAEALRHLQPPTWADLGANGWFVQPSTGSVDTAAMFHTALYCARFAHASVIPRPAFRANATRTLHTLQNRYVQRVSLPLVLLAGMVLLLAGLLFHARQQYQRLRHALIKNQDDKLKLIRQLEQEKQKALNLRGRDPLTGLYSRSMFYELANHLLSHAQHASKHYALLYLNLDRFKSVNDTLGYMVADALLQAVAQRLTGMLRQSDTIARLGADEYAVLLYTMESTACTDGWVSRLMDGLSAPYEGIGIAAPPLHISASVGVALFPSDGHDANTLCNLAQDAMVAAKRAGRNRCMYYERLSFLNGKMEGCLARELPTAIAQEQLLLHFQPKICLQDRTIVGLEALIRWQHPQQGLIYPGDFIAQAEALGHIQVLGDWVVQACCRQIAAWRLQGIRIVPIAFNVSPLQLRDVDFPRRISTWLQHYGVQAQEIEVEITESCLVDSSGAAQQVLRQLQEMGIRIAMDDFGTGYSSLSQIRALPIQTIKLDKSFAKELCSNQKAGVLVTSIITLAHNLKLQVVAEGVEKMDQFVFLKTAGCDVVQGYFLSRPLPAQCARELLLKRTLEPA